MSTVQTNSPKPSVNSDNFFLSLLTNDEIDNVNVEFLNINSFEHLLGTNIKTENDVKPTLSDTNNYAFVYSGLIEAARNTEEGNTCNIKVETYSCQPSPPTLNYIDSLKLYTYCFVLPNSKTLSYYCNTCSFSTISIKDAVSHFVNNGSETSSTNFIIYNKEKLTFECNSCRFTTTNDEETVKHWETHLCNISLKCFVCSFITEEDTLLKIHLISHLHEMGLINNVQVGDRSATPFMCSECDVSMTTEHLTQHTRKRFCCGMCEIQFHDLEKLKIHIEDCVNTRDTINIPDQYKKQREPANTHPSDVGTTQYKCRYCSFSSIFKKYLKQHLIANHSDKVTYLNCSLCSEVCAERRTLERHIHLKHGNKQKYECEQCDFQTVYKRTLAEHMAQHTGEFSHLCYICGHQSINAKSMAVHIFSHNASKSISCNLCNYKCSTVAMLGKHMDSHITQKLYSCNICGHRTSTKYYLKRHKRTHTDLTQSKSFKCDICSYSSILKSRLIKHLAIHSTTRYFRCNECGKEYLSKFNMRAHERSHFDIKVNKCSVCAASFISACNLRTHMKSHTGEGRMYCFQCNYSTTHKANFIMHVNKTCAKAKHVNVYQMHCYRCGFASCHRSNFVKHVNKGCGKLKTKTLITNRTRSMKR